METLVLFSQLGENSTTPMEPVAPWRGQADLTAMVTCCVSSDFDMLVSVPAHEVRAVELPSWLSAAEWCANSVAWKYVWGAGVDPTWPEAWQRGLARLSFVERHAAAALLRVKNFRSEFRLSLRNQLVTWLEAPVAERRRSPLSERQWECLVRSPWAAKGLEEALYRNRSWQGRPVEATVALAAVSEAAAA